MKNIFLIGMLLICTSANAEELNIKNLKPGDDINLINNNEYSCPEVDKAIPRYCISNQKYTYAGYQAKAHIKIDDNKIKLISLTFNPDNFDNIKNTLIYKYGEPYAVDTELLSNAMGAQFTNENIQWISKNSVILLTKYNKKITESNVLLVGKDTLENQPNESKNKLRSRASDI